MKSLRRAPLFSALAIATIALGIAANTAIFSMVEGVLLRRLPYASGERIIHVRQASSLLPDTRFSIPEIQDLRAQSTAFDAIVEYHSMSFQLYGLGDPQRLQTGVVSDNFFQVFGVQPVLGRLFRKGEEEVGAPPVVLLSYTYWHNVLGSDPKVIGAKFTMNDRVHTVVGVLPPLPVYPDNNDIWLPAGACPFRSAPPAMASRTARLPTVFARLRPRVSMARGTVELQTIEQKLHGLYSEAYPPGNGLHVTTETVHDELTKDSKPLLLILFATAVFLMIVAAANFAGLTIARQLRRGRELAVREALGASRLRMFSQLASESLLLALLGGVLGTLLAWSGLGLLRTFATRLTPRAGDIGIDAVVLGFDLLTVTLVGLLAAAVPFIRGRGGALLIDRLRQGNSGAMATRGEGHLRSAFVLAQIAIAFVLLVGAALVGRSLLHLERVDAGFNGHDVLTARITLNFSKYSNAQRVLAFNDQLMSRLASTPGLDASAIASTLPLNNAVTRTRAFTIGGVDATTGAQSPRGDFTSVSPRYFQTLGIPVVRGRAFSESDRDTADVPVILSQRLAASFWGTRDPIGTRISTDSGKTWSRVIGIVGDVHQNGLDHDVGQQVYMPSTVIPTGDMRVFVRFKGPSAPIALALRGIIRDMDPQQAVVAVQTLDQVRGTQLTEPRLTSVLLASFAVVALVLAATGLAGIVGYSVSQRIPEIAIRMALGADAWRIIGMVGRDGLSIVVIGLVFGGVIALSLSRFIRSVLFQIQPTDLATYAGVGALLLLTAALACFTPIRRAVVTDAARILRSS
ncbi:MAG TPA: ABC transporter permease [Gemmatimonadaceae bacterium]|nr:ABC transporter permease [Gemmatimonadaceae bacterium]